VVSSSGDREHLLRRALDDAGLRVLYQPVVDTTECLCGVDVLVRVFVPGRGLVSPADVGEVNAAFGVTSVDEWALGQSVAQARRWRELVPGARPFVSWMVSDATLAERDVDDLVARALDANEVRPEQIRVSMSTSTLAGSDARAREALVALRLRHVEIGVDAPVGSGWDAPGTEIVSFVRIGASAAAEVAEAVEIEARKRGVAVVVSAVENADDARRWQGHCDLLEGPWYSSPVGPEVITAMLRAHRPIIETTAR
jgi:EAL domain-containing protein (putative c-di-GMP-specific phosphodiesterase class I)